MNNFFSIKNFRIILISFFVGFLVISLTPKNLFAAEISFKIIPNTTLNDSSTIVEVHIDPQSKRLNVVEGVVRLDGSVADKISAKIETGGSVLTLWPTQPQYTSNDKSIHFTGGVAGGFDKEGALFRIRLSSSESGNIKISWAEGMSYLNDGKGTRDLVISKSLDLKLDKSTITSIATNTVNDISNSTDKNPPVFDTVEIGRDKDSYDGKYFVSFHAIDDSSGISRYEVKEGDSITNVIDGTYIFKDQSRMTPVLITAYDQAGNFSTKEIPVKNNWNQIMDVVIVLILAILIIVYIARRKINNNIKKYTALFLVVFSLVGWNSASAATMQLSSNSTSLNTGETTTLRVLLNADGTAVNNAEAVIKFQTDLISVVSISKGGSVFSLWVEDPSFSNSDGTITFNGGIPNPGFSGSQGTIISIVVKAKKAGQATFTLSDAAVRANDGLGTDVLNSKQGKTISIANKDEGVALSDKNTTAVSTQSTSQISTPIITALKITSPTYPDQNKWYNDANGIFKLILPSGSDAVKTSLDNKIAGLPNVLNSPAITEKVFKNLDDGIWYFKVRARKGGVWGPVSIYTARVDKTEPQQDNVSFNYDDNAKVLNIESTAQDTTSGIDRYEIYLNGVLAKTVPANEFIDNKYSIPLNIAGDNNVKLLVFDYAGNHSESSGTFHASGTLTALLDPMPSIVNVNDKLFIHGKTQNPNVDVSINIKSENGAPTTYFVKSDSEKNFFILAPKLDVGKYEIWTEIDSDYNKMSSAHLNVEVTSHMLISIGTFTFIALYPIAIVSVIILILIIMLMYHIGRLHGRLVIREEKVTKKR
jgi:hypothetical protein